MRAAPPRAPRLLGAGQVHDLLGRSAFRSLERRWALSQRLWECPACSITVPLP